VVIERQVDKRVHGDHAQVFLFIFHEVPRLLDFSIPLHGHDNIATIVSLQASNLYRKVNFLTVR